MRNLCCCVTHPDAREQLTPSVVFPALAASLHGTLPGIARYVMYTAESHQVNSNSQGWRQHAATPICAFAQAPCTASPDSSRPNNCSQCGCPRRPNRSQKHQAPLTLCPSLKELGGKSQYRTNRIGPRQHLTHQHPTITTDQHPTVRYHPSAICQVTAAMET